ncbi:MAG: cytochrome ubiquinol oxidase subunit I [Thermoguttaceae bacterium]|nr:cytochrome ubiquinol oxidase subunit I [Thermoguttaceae bacterium]
MYYPWLDIPFLTAPTLVKTIAALFAFVAYYAVGGGILLALENGSALRAEDSKYRAYLRKHARFFILFTVPLGMTTCLGLLFALGLVTPLVAQTLVRHFAFVFAIEWCLWLLALVSIFVFYYCWDKLSPRASRAVGWVYAATAWWALALLTSISSFMLNSTGFVEDYESTNVLWHALLNVQLFPQTIVRTGGALLMGAMFFLVHASYCEKDLNLRERVAKKMRASAFIGGLLMLLGVVGWVFFLPETSRLTLERLSSTSSCAGLFCAVMAAIFILLIVGPCVRPREINPAQTLALLFLTFVCVGIFEHTRESVGNPYAIDRIVYVNQLYRGDVQETRQLGLLYKGTWTTFALDALQEEYPDLKISAANYLGAESIHLAPPVVPEHEDVEEPEDKDDESESVEEDADSGTETLGLDGSVGFFVQTAAQRQPLAERQNFAPVSSNPDVDALQSRSPASPLNPAPTLREPQAPLSGQTTAGLQGAVLQNPEQGRAVRNAGVPQSESPNSSLQTRGNALSANPAGSGVQPGRNAATPDSPVAALSSGPQTSLQPQVPTQNIPIQDVGGTESVNRPRRPTRVQTPPVLAEEIPEPEPSVPSIPDPASEIPVDVDEERPISEETSEEEREESLTRVLSETLDFDVNGPIARGNEELLKTSHRDQIELGRMVFMYHCNSCHAPEHGRLAVGPLVAGLGASEIKSLVLRLNYSRFDMPPWAGTDVEAELLAEYLDSIAPKTPDNAFMKDKPKKSPKTTPKKSKKPKKQKDAETGVEEESGEPEEGNEPTEDISDDELSALPEDDDLPL